MHQPVLLKQLLDFFKERKITSFIDGTLGAGGHARALLEAHPEIEKFYGIDQDPEALEIASKILTPFSNKIEIYPSNFRHMGSLFAGKKVEGILLDLGVSSMQLDRPEKGFSFSKGGPLDMRMDPSQPLDAATVVNQFSAAKLGEIFRELGEERRWKSAAAAIVEGRRKKRIQTTEDLANILKPVLTWGGRTKGKKIHPFTLVFQALRIYVNDELKVIQEVIPQALSLLNPGGRLVIISFHSLEDRLVKVTFKEYAKEKRGVLLTKKPLEADEEEIKENPRSRSAKMRCIESCSQETY